MPPLFPRPGIPHRSFLTPPDPAIKVPESGFSIRVCWSYEYSSSDKYSATSFVNSLVSMKLYIGLLYGYDVHRQDETETLAARYVNPRQGCKHPRIHATAYLKSDFRVLAEAEDHHGDVIMLRRICRKLISVSIREHKAKRGGKEGIREERVGRSKLRSCSGIPRPDEHLDGIRVMLRIIAESGCGRSAERGVRKDPSLCSARFPDGAGCGRPRAVL